jgi:integrase
MRKYLDLPDQCFRYADRLAAEGKLKMAAYADQRALALAILQEFALRRRNLAAIDIKRHLSRDSRGRIAALTIDGSETKNGVTLGGEVRGELARRIERHLTKYRPHLPGSQSTWLFPSRTGTGHCSEDALTARLRKTIATLAGIRMSPHDQRHLVAKLFAERDPTAMPVVQRMLGHADLKTTERMYGTMTTAAAQGSYAELLDDLRERRNRADRRRAARKAGKP